MNPTRRSTVGRPRSLTDAQVAEILAWATARMSVLAKARQYGVSISTIQDVIRHGSAHYKQPSPEQRSANRAAFQTHRARLRKAHWL